MNIDIEHTILNKIRRITIGTIEVMKNHIAILIIGLFLMNPVFAQEHKMPVLSPYELGAKGDVALPWEINGNEDEIHAWNSHKMDIKDLPGDIPYRSVAFFQNDRLFSLHVLFGEAGDGLSKEDYQSLKNLFHKLWKYPSLTMKDRRGKGNTAEVWETPDFRIEWIYKNQDGPGLNKMGWLFIYTRDHYIESYQ
ncbi:hypothetical protein [Fluviicola sp.]|uniref:hypothetical protein n=1 Tax=Fluviicola sp. TaxID=1917219 RepID=UPI0031D7B6B9